MNLKTELTAAFIDAYYQTGKTTGYWANRFLQAVRKQGGLARAKEMLRPRTTNQRAGLDALLSFGSS